MKKLFCFIVFFTAISNAFAQTPLLPDVENVRIEGDMLVWDAQDGASGYNVTRNYRYYDTVKNATTYMLTEPGTYRVTPFNDDGYFGSDYGLTAEYDGSDPDRSVSYSYNFYTLIVYQTCKNVGPGESCIARCPSSYEPDLEYTTTVYPRSITGGACSTSDIVEADAWIGHRSYQCTVPTFSGEVVAQAMCRLN